MGIGFRVEVVGLSDDVRGLVGRAVWTDERGDRVFSELKGEWVGTGNHDRRHIPRWHRALRTASPANTNSSGNT